MEETIMSMIQELEKKLQILRDLLKAKKHAGNLWTKLYFWGVIIFNCRSW
jgi:hypothetical protein